MLRLKSILCPIDFSEFSIKAYDYAQSLAAHYRVPLLLQHVLYAIPPFYTDPAYEATCRKLRADALRKLQLFAKRRTRTKIRPECVVQEGAATDQILSFAEARGVRLIVMGTHGLRGLDRLMIGSVTEHVLRKARCPVLVVRTPAHDFVSPGKAGDPVRLKRILLCMDFSQHAHHGLRLALSIAREYSASLTVLHVVEHCSRSADVTRAAAATMKRLKGTIPSPAGQGLVPKFAVRFGNPYCQIVGFTQEAQTDLVIMGVRGHSSVDSALFGATTYRVIQLGSCPVLAVHI
jgi:nucleotide-binding universal stress UspA family protein